MWTPEQTHSDIHIQQLLDYLGLLHLVLLQTKGSHLTLGFPLVETVRLILPTKGSHLTLGFQHRYSAKPVLPISIVVP